MICLTAKQGGPEIWLSDECVQCNDYQSGTRWGSARTSSRRYAGDADGVQPSGEVRVSFMALIAPVGKMLRQRLVEAEIPELPGVVLANLPSPDYIGRKDRRAVN